MVVLKTLLKQIKQYRKASVLAAVFTVLFKMVKFDMITLILEKLKKPI